MENIITVLDIKLLQKSKILNVTFSNGLEASFSCYDLRQHSPAADAKQEDKSQLNKDVNIIGIDPVGNYAVKLIFDDGHQTGIYSFTYLYELAKRAQA